MGKEKIMKTKLSLALLLLSCSLSSFSSDLTMQVGSISGLTPADGNHCEMLKVRAFNNTRIVATTEDEYSGNSVILVLGQISNMRSMKYTTALNSSKTKSNNEVVVMEYQGGGPLSTYGVEVVVDRHLTGLEAIKEYRYYRNFKFPYSLTNKNYVKNCIVSHVE